MVILALLVAAIVCLLLATIGVGHPRVNMLALGVLLFVVAATVPVAHALN